MNFLVFACDEKGCEVDLRIAAADEKSAIELVRQKGYFPYKVQVELSGRQKKRRKLKLVFLTTTGIVLIASLLYNGSYNYRVHKKALAAFHDGRYQQSVDYIQKMSEGARTTPSIRQLFWNSHFNLAKREFELKNFYNALAHLELIPISYPDRQDVDSLLENVNVSIDIQEEAERAKKLSEDKAAKEIALAESIKSAEKDREARIQRGFSFWNESHIGLSREIKKRMNDPKSYEHVETHYLDRGSELLVTTRFRGKNAFGGLVVNTAIARTDLDGNVLEMVSFGQ
jgi:hypothetical protein